MERFFKAIDTFKQQEHKIAIPLLQFFNNLFLTQLFVGGVNTGLPIIFTLIELKCQKEVIITWGIILFVVLVLTNFFNILCVKYENHANNLRIVKNTTLCAISSVYKAYNELVSNNDYESLFEKISKSVCTQLYHYIKDGFNLETRVSVVQQYKKNEHEKNRSFIVSRTSKDTCTLNRHKNDEEVRYGKSKGNKVKGRYYNKILLDNKDDVVILNKEEIDSQFWFKSQKNKKDLQWYIAVPQKAYGIDIAFILQIDILSEYNRKVDKTRVENFVNTYIDPYICVLQNAYLIELTHNQV